MAIKIETEVDNGGGGAVGGGTPVPGPVATTSAFSKYIWVAVAAVVAIGLFLATK